MVELRRHFHQYPEVAFKEFKTMDKILEYVGKMGTVHKGEKNLKKKKKNLQKKKKKKIYKKKSFFFFPANPTGLFVDIRGEGPRDVRLDKDRIIGFRADMDALPITEETNIEYKSKNIGSAHSCGHDNVFILFNFILFYFNFIYFILF